MDPLRRSGRSVVVRPSTDDDRRWLLRAGFARELIGTQYHWSETPLQVVVAPMRALGWPPGPSCVVEVDGARGGYIGRNPLSGNLEYWLEPWARGGTGTRAITAFLASWARSGDKARSFFVARRNQRSLRALLGAFETLGWTEGLDFTRRQGRLGWRVEVNPEHLATEST